MRESCRQVKAQRFLRKAATLREAERFDTLWSRALLAEGKLPPSQDLNDLNRLILEASYAPPYIEQRTKAGWKLCWGRDQWCRAWWMIGSAIAFGILSLTVNLNATSLHGFYKRKLEDAYVVKDNGAERTKAKDSPDEVQKAKDPGGEKRKVKDAAAKKLEDLKTTDAGGPLSFLVCHLELLRRLALGNRPSTARRIRSSSASCSAGRRPFVGKARRTLETRKTGRDLRKRYAATPGPPSTAVGTWTLPRRRQFPAPPFRQPSPGTRCCFA